MNLQIALMAKVERIVSRHVVYEVRVPVQWDSCSVGHCGQLGVLIVGASL